METLSKGWRAIRHSLQKQKLGVYPLAPVTTPTTRAIEKLREFFEAQLTRYQLYDALIRLDPELQAAISTTSMMISKAMVGFSLEAGETLEPEEEEMQNELRKLETVLLPYTYDIAYKLFAHGDACFLTDFVKGVGLRELKWLPIDKLTVLESKDQATRLVLSIQEPNWYVLNETFPEELYGKGLMTGTVQWFPAKDIVHFNWGRTEVVTDRLGRITYGIFTLPPLESMSSKLIWKFSIQINDMLMREVLVPREHHKLPAAMFDPDLFMGATQEDRIKAAQDAADAFVTHYANQLKGRRVDRGYVTLDNTEIKIVEPSVKYSDPNPLLTQIDTAIYGSIGISESAVSGRVAARGTFATERAIAGYMVMKAEFFAERIAKEYIALAKRHLETLHGDKYREHFEQIRFELQLLFFRQELARQLAVLTELGLFTKTELRRMFGFSPLREDQLKEIVETGRSHTQTPAEVQSTDARRESPQRPLTDWSRDQQQKTELFRPELSKLFKSKFLDSETEEEESEEEEEEEKEEEE